MGVSVKICGINSASAADAALRAGADFGGLVFFERSPRNLTFEASGALATRMRGRLRLAALVVDADDEHLARIAADVKPDFFQLHGKETPARAAEVAARFRIPVIKAFSVAEPAVLAAADAYEAVAEMFLFDAPPAADATRPGGYGVAFDWVMLKNRNFHRPWFLAGGLDPENVERAIAASGARMVDVSSGVESAPGVKSAARIADFAAAARNCVPV
jgi:phosphoribosylanthranilate isomerase